MTPNTIFYTAIGLTAAAIGWGLAQLLMAAMQKDRRRLEERLSMEMERGITPGAAATLLKKQAELPAALAESALFRRLNRRLGHVFPGVTVARLLLLMAALGGGAAAGIWVLADSIPGAVVAGFIVVAIPLIVVNVKYSKFQRTIADQLTDALDFLARTLLAGHSLATGFQMMSEELPEPIATQFRRCYQQHALGAPLEEAMTSMASHIDSTDFAFFVTAVLIQRQTGGDLAEVLDNISTMVRGRIRLQQHTQALTAEGRLSAYILLVLPPALFLFMWFRKPDYATMLLYNPLGRTMLMIVAALQVIGIVAMRKIVHVKV